MHACMHAYHYTLFQKTAEGYTGLGIMYFYGLGVEKVNMYMSSYYYY